MNYEETLNWMFQQLPMYQRKGKSAFKKDLTNIIKLTAHLGHPEKSFKSVHIAGTNGKGSTCHILASILQKAGYKTGLHTSPHLKDFRERIKINGQPVSESFVTEFIKSHTAFLEKEDLSFFEMSVGMAFQYFAEQKIDITLIETGLGGRLDSTNIISPELSVITNIGLDHTHILGDTLAKIAIEKAGIIKPKTPVIIGEKNKATLPVFQKKAKEVQAPLHMVEHTDKISFKSDLKGIYQKQNIQTALKSIDILRQLGWSISNLNIEKGLQNVIKNTGLLGRWQELQESPKIICDTAHNTEGLNYVLTQLKKESYKDLHIVLGVVNDKDLSTILPLFPKEAHYYFSKPNVPRGLNENKLAKTAKEFSLTGSTFKDVNSALNAAKQAATEEDLIFIGGSTFTVAEVL